MDFLFVFKGYSHMSVSMAGWADAWRGKVLLNQPSCKPCWYGNIWQASLAILSSDIWWHEYTNFKGLIRIYLVTKYYTTYFHIHPHIRSTSVFACVFCKCLENSCCLDRFIINAIFVLLAEWLVLKTGILTITYTHTSIQPITESVLSLLHNVAWTTPADHQLFSASKMYIGEKYSIYGDSTVIVHCNSEFLLVEHLVATIDRKSVV